ncbi:DUF3995 domain-containing protein [Zhouia amylolytica]|nr:DUF3995 domain-containing protein [Zhouia amylolytica]
MMVLSLILSFVFIVLAIIHFNWVLGGNFGLSVALPTNEQGIRVLHPKKADSAIVGAGLLTFGLFYLNTSGFVMFRLPEWIYSYGGWIIPAIFFLRAIGEFKYIGFFKKIKHTPFGKMDTKLFSPLCLLIAVIGILIQLFQ